MKLIPLLPLFAKSSPLSAVKQGYFRGGTELLCSSHIVNLLYYHFLQRFSLFKPTETFFDGLFLQSP